MNLRNAGIQGASGAAILNLAQQSAIAACDALDGVTDGMIANPSRCNWNPATLICQPGQNPATCITPVQAAALTANVSTVTDPVTGAWFFPGLSRGSEHDLLRFNANNAVTSYGLSLYQIALNDPNWDASTFNLHRDSAILDQKLAAINAIDPNLAPFKKAGGKLIQWHSWDDSQFMPLWQTQYYEQVASAMGGVEGTEDFYRLFMMPAQGHCAGNGVGPSNIGAENQLAVSSDADHDIVTALESWVVQGIAPKQLIATRFKNNDAALGVDMQRPLCPYPLEAVYKGAGDTNVAANFYCGRLQP